nr:hypothetical protein [Pseudomonas syringae]
MHDALMAVVEHCEWVQTSAGRGLGGLYDSDEAKAKLRGYLEALVQVGCISANHPLCLLT